MPPTASLVIVPPCNVPPRRDGRRSATLLFQALVTLRSPSSSLVPIDVDVDDASVDRERAVVGAQVGRAVEVDRRVDRAEAVAALAGVGAQDAGAADRAAGDRVGIVRVVAAGEPQRLSRPC